MEVTSIAVSSADGTQLLVPLVEGSQVGEARRVAVTIAADLGFDQTDRARVALVLTEAATNTVLHGGGGMLLLRTFGEPHARGLEAVFHDRGPGMADIGRALRDGHSTAGTPGTGLGAIRRQSDFFDLYSNPGAGTVLVIRLHPRPPSGRGRVEYAGADPSQALDFGIVCLPCPGESVSGDAWAAVRREGRTALMVADGLGHGVHAAAASGAAVEVFRASKGGAPVELLREIHAALRSTRGATVAIADLDRTRREIRYAGLGNIAGSILTDDGSRSMVSHNGTVGHELHRVQEFTYPWPKGAVVIMHSDGLQSHWRLDQYPGLFAKHPAVIAGILQRDHTRGRDDVSILVAREAA